MQRIAREADQISAADLENCEHQHIRLSCSKCTPQQITPDFKMTEPDLRFIDGKPFFVRICEELIDGRWEGFVSMVPARSASEFDN